MGIFYAQTATTVEIPFSTILNPGSYRVALSLVDETHDITASADSLTLIVEKPAAPVAPDGTPQVATIDQQPGAPTDAAAAPDSNGTSAAVLVAVGAVSGCLVFGIIAGGMLWVRRRPTANSPRSGTSGVADPPASASVSIPAVQRPVTVTQLISRPTMEQDQ
jgi:hypothetical protein